MRKILIASLLAAGALPAAAATYMPVGPQTNVALSDVTGGGWTLCYSALMSTPFGNSASTTLANCHGDRVLLAGRETGSDTLLALAQTTFADAFADTGAGNNGVFTTSNGADWFYSDQWSWGFKPIGVGFTKYQCDFNAPDSSLCVHTLNFAGGYSINTIVGLNNSSAYEKLVFVANDGPGGVPEPATWAMLIAGFGMVGATLRRRAPARA